MRWRRRDDNLDYVLASRGALGFPVWTLSSDEDILHAWIQSAAVVYLPLMAQYIRVDALCRRVNVPVVYDADLTPEIREGIVRQPDYAVLAAQADLIVADGMPLLWASRLQQTPLPERITGSNLIWSVSREAAARGRSVFMLGGSDNAARHSAEILTRVYPSFHLAGVHVPPFGFERDAGELAHLRESVISAQPDVVFVALSAPKQAWLIQQLRRLVPGTWFIGVGISFSWVAGQLPRAPHWMQQAGLEWLHRLAHEPRRLTRRYLIDDLPFAAHLFGSILKRRLRRE